MSSRRTIYANLSSCLLLLYYASAKIISPSTNLVNEGEKVINSEFFSHMSVLILVNYIWDQIYINQIQNSLICGDWLVVNGSIAYTRIHTQESTICRIPVQMLNTYIFRTLWILTHILSCALHIGNISLPSDWFRLTCVSESIRCDPNPCENGGTCHDTGINTISCSCAENFEGELCQNGEHAQMNIRLKTGFQGLDTGHFLISCFYRFQGFSRNMQTKLIACMVPRAVHGISIVLRVYATSRVCRSTNKTYYVVSALHYVWSNFVAYYMYLKALNMWNNYWFLIANMSSCALFRLLCACTNIQRQMQIFKFSQKAIIIKYAISYLALIGMLVNWVNVHGGKCIMKYKLTYH